jgi:nitrate reductase alpha subunit
VLKADIRKYGMRGGIHNSVTRIVLKPTHMIGGYAQLSYGFNYYGTIGTTLAKQMGTSVLMIERHYSHLQVIQAIEQLRGANT